MHGQNWVHILQKPTEFTVAVGVVLNRPLPPIEDRPQPIDYTYSFTCSVPVKPKPPSESYYLNPTDALRLLDFLASNKAELERLAAEHEAHKRLIVKDAIAELGGAAQ